MGKKSGANPAKNSSGKNVGHRWTKETRPVSPGRPRIPDDVKLLRAISQEQIDHVGECIMQSDEVALKKIAMDKTQPVMLVAVARCALNAMETCNWEMLSSIFDRVCGGIRQQKKVVHSGRIDSSTEATNTNISATIGPDDIKQIIKELKEDV